MVCCVLSVVCWRFMLVAALCCLLFGAGCWLIWFVCYWLLHVGVVWRCCLCLPVVDVLLWFSVACCLLLLVVWNLLFGVCCLSRLGCCLLLVVCLLAVVGCSSVGFVCY